MMRILPKATFFTIAFLFYGLGSILYAQPNASLASNHMIIDSLEQLLDAQEEMYPDGNLSQVSIYLTLLEKYRISYHERTDSLALRAYNFAIKHNAEDVLLAVYNTMGFVCLHQGRYQKAKFSLLEGLKLAESIEEPYVSRVEFLNSLGILYAHLEKYDEASKKYFEVVQYSKESCIGYPDSLCTIGVIKGLNNLGTIYNRLRAYDKAIEFYEEAKLLGTGLAKVFPHDKEVLFALGTTVGSIGHLHSRLEELDSAIYYFQESIELLTAAKDNANLPVAKQFLADAYIKQREFQKAEELLLEVIDLKETLGQSTTEVATIYVSAGQLYYAKEDFEKALLYVDKSLAITEEHNTSEILANALELKTKIKIKQGDLIAANDLFERFVIHKDSSLHFDQRTIISTLEARNRVAEKERALALEKAKLSDIEKENIKRNYAFTLVTLLLLTIIIVGINNRNRLIQKNKAVSLEQDKLVLEIQDKKRALEFKNKELASLAGKLLERSRLLKQIQQELAVNDNDDGFSINKLQKQLNLDHAVQQDVANFQIYLDEVSSDFMFALSRRFPDLSESEKRLCAMIRMGWSTSDIAALNNSTHSAIRTRKSRLKKKLNLGDQSLQETLQEV